MAGKNIKVAEIRNEYLAMFSDWNVARVRLEELENTLGEEVKAIRKAVEEMPKTGKIMINGVPHDYVSACEYRDDLISDYNDACKPHRETMRKAANGIPSIAYDSYVLAIRGTNGADSVGRVEVHKKGRQYEVFAVGENHTFRKCAESMLTAIGVTGNEKALAKFVESFLLKISGTKKANYTKTGNLYTVINENAFREQCIRVMLEDYIINNAAFDVADNGKITKHDFSKDEKPETAEKPSK